MAYAEATRVEVGATKAEIEKLMTKAGATAFVVGQDGSQAKVMFRLQDRMYRFELTVPDGVQAARTRWRALLLILKAKIEAVNTGIVSLEDEFLAQTMFRDGETVSQKAKRQIDEHYRVGGPPQLLLSARTFGDQPNDSEVSDVLNRAEAIVDDPIRARAQAQRAWLVAQEAGRASQGELRAFTDGWRACFDAIQPGVLLHEVRRAATSSAGGA